ncbi:MAG: hypothetical protein AB7P23_01650 [Amphiplicatus sp.]
MWFRSTWLAALALVAAGGCASTIGNLSDIESTKFVIGETQKSDVAETLGFPQSRATEDGFEYWGYRKNPRLSGVIYALPSGPNTVTTYQTTVIEGGPPRFRDAHMIYVFDGAGALTDVIENDKRK